VSIAERLLNLKKFSKFMNTLKKIYPIDKDFGDLQEEDYFYFQQ